MNSQTRAGRLLQDVFEMANIPPKAHKINVAKYPDLKINIRQPGLDNKFKHDTSVKVFRGTYYENEVWVIRFNRDNGSTEEINTKKFVTSELRRLVLTFIQNNYENLTKLWDDQGLDWSEIEWITE